MKPLFTQGEGSLEAKLTLTQDFQSQQTAPSNDIVWQWLSFIRNERWSAKQKREILGVEDGCGGLFELSVGQRASMFKAPPQFKSDRAEAKSGDGQKRVPFTEMIVKDYRWLCGSSNHLITIFDRRYPSLLKQIADPPIALFVRGDPECLTLPKIAIVGSRRPTPIGRTIATQLAQQLAELGVVITSGLALGVDGAAHQGALKTTTETVAVLACGLDHFYPRQHKQLHEEVANQGCLVSEYPLGRSPNHYSFPQRNRIVSGLSAGVVIIEAAEQSGTLITARLALEQDRELMVVPGSALSKQYSGSHRLIAQGAAIVTGVHDVLRELQEPLQLWLTETKIEQASQIRQAAVEAARCEQSQRVLQCLGAESTALDALIVSSGLTSAEVSSMLLVLELEGVVAVCDDGGYVTLE